MPGTLVISTLSDGTNSTSATNCISGSAKAWAKFNGSGGVTIASSYNISSITRTSTAQYYASFTNALTDGNWILAGSASDNTSGYCWGVSPAPFSGTQSGTTAYFEGWQANQANDRQNIQIVFFR